MARLPQSPGTHPPRRVDGIDFWRGVVLCTIFINHIPGNLFECVTQKNFGFSDSAEAFVFLSGVSLALAYASRFTPGQRGKVIGSMARRAVRLYSIHIVLTLTAIGIFSIGAMATTSDALLSVHGRELFVDDPRAALIGLFSLGHQLGYFNILPLYILLLAAVPLLLWIGKLSPRLMLAASSAIYLAARAFEWNIPTWPMKGTWFFDPFAWQLMMTIGLCAGLTLRNIRLPRSPWLIGLAAGVVVFSAFSVTNGFSLEPGLQDWTGTWADLNKTVLGFGRIVHFLALSYLIALVDLPHRIRGRAAFGVLCSLGRHSLAVFAVLSVLAAIGQVLVEAFGHSALLDAAIIGGGFGTLCGAAKLLETKRPERTAEAIA